MKKLTLVSCALVLSASVAQAQASAGDGAAWSAIMFTPVGAFPTILTTGNTPQLAIRVSTWKYEGSNDRSNNFGVTWMNPSTSPLRYALTFGWNQPSGGSGSNDGTVMLGGVAGGALWKSAMANSASSFSLGWKANAGYGRYLGTGGGNAWSLVGQVPLSWTYTMASKSVLSAYGQAGFGFAGLSDDTDSESGTRPMFGAGGAWTSAGGIGVHLGWQKVPLDIGSGSVPGVMALSVSFPMGGAK